MGKWLKLMIFVFSFCFGQDTKYNLSICALFKNETKFLKEWIEYHRLIGVDHFYLYSNGSSDSPEIFLQNYIDKKIVTFQKWLDPSSAFKEERPLDWALSTQVTAYENAILMKKNETKWLIFLDIDEFLVPSKKDTLVDLLKKHNDCSGIELTSRFFSTSLNHYFSEKNLVLENIHLIDPPSKNICKTAKKMIVKPAACKSFKWSPYRCIFGKSDKVVSLDQELLCINNYIGKKKNFPHHHTRNIQINNRLLTKQEEAIILEEGYQLEDQKKTVFSYLPKLKRKMDDVNSLMTDE